MTQTTAEQMRQWRGPAILSFGFRAMFTLAGLWAVLAMGLWILMLTDLIELPTRFDPVTWHTHEFLFGYLSAVMAGFLLTAVPNWTGRLPVVGWHLASLAGLWIIGRAAVFMSTYLPIWSVIAADMAFLLVLSCVILREIIAAKNWKNLPVLILIGVLMVANLVFHLESAAGAYAPHGFGLRLGVSVVLVLVMLISGKIIPSFTRNWLVKQGASRLPTPPMQRFDKATLVVTIMVMIGWTSVPDARLTGSALLVMVVLHAIRLTRWQGVATGAEPLVWVLHVAYAFVPLGAALNALSVFVPNAMSQAAALHVWTAGAIGLMTLAVMTRASLGHSGRDLHATHTTTLAYCALIASVVTRVLADVIFDLRGVFLNTSGALWIVAFATFVIAYGPMLATAKPERTS